MTAVWIALIGLGTGALGSLVAPWAQWGVEKRREERAHRRALLKSWRDGIASWEASRHGLPRSGDERQSLISSDWYQSLAGYVETTLRQEIERGTALHVGNPRRVYPAAELQAEVDRIEVEWGLR